MDVNLILKLKKWNETKFSYWFYNKIFRTKSIKNFKNQREHTKDPLLTKVHVLGLKLMLSVSNTKYYLHL